MSASNFEARDGHVCQGGAWFVKPESLRRMFELRPDAKGGRKAVPFGLKYVTRPKGWGSHRSHMLESEKEINDSRMKSVGWKTGLNLIVVDFSVHHNKTTQSRREELKNNKTTFSEYKNIQTEFALVLDKENIRLTDAFSRSVRSLIDTRNYKIFMDTWGTHVSYATTFGMKGHQVNKYTQEQVQKLAADSVNISTGASAGITIPLEEFGIPGSVGMSFGGDDASAKEHAIKLKHELQENWGDYSCEGGMTCKDGTPTGEAAVPIFLDLMPVSEFLGPPFLKFSYPSRMVKSEKTLFRGVSRETFLEVRAGLRNAIAEYAFATNAVDRPLNTLAAEYMRLSHFKPRTGSCTVTTTINSKTSSPKKGNDKDCVLSNLQVAWTDSKKPKKYFAVNASGRGIVIDKPQIRSNGNSITFFNIKGDVSLASSLCHSDGAVALSGVAWGSLFVPATDGSNVFEGNIAANVIGKGGVNCLVTFKIDLQVDVGGAGLMLNAD